MESEGGREKGRVREEEGRGRRVDGGKVTGRGEEAKEIRDGEKMKGRRKRGREERRRK